MKRPTEVHDQVHCTIWARRKDKSEAGRTRITVLPIQAAAIAQYFCWAVVGSYHQFLFRIGCEVSLKRLTSMSVRIVSTRLYFSFYVLRSSARVRTVECLHLGSRKETFSISSTILVKLADGRCYGPLASPWEKKRIITMSAVLPLYIVKGTVLPRYQHKVLEGSQSIAYLLRFWTIDVIWGGVLANWR